MKKILILGSTGMLGMMVYRYFSEDKDFKVIGTERNSIKKNKLDFDVEDFLINPKKYVILKKFHYIINCIGLIKPYCKDNDPVGVERAIKVNALFPHELANYLVKTNVKVIQIATDCVYSGKKGRYVESDLHDPLDVYGKTKSLGEVFKGNFLNIRCSIVGPEMKNRLSLLEWFLSQKDNSVVNGFLDHKWNGVTTLQFAQLCKLLIEENKFEQLVRISHIYHFLPNNEVSKYELLKIFKEVFKKKVSILKSKSKEKIDRTLSTNYDMLGTLSGKSEIVNAITELKNYTERNG